MTDSGTKQTKDLIRHKGWTMYYPNGPEGPEYGVIKLLPSIVKGWCQNGPFSLKP
jgi:general stress protein 26